MLILVTDLAPSGEAGTTMGHMLDYDLLYWILIWALLVYSLWEPGKTSGTQTLVQSKDWTRKAFRFLSGKSLCLEYSEPHVV